MKNNGELIKNLFAQLVHSPLQKVRIFYHVGTISPLRKENSLVIFCLKIQFFDSRREVISLSTQKELPVNVIQKSNLGPGQLKRSKVALEGKKQRKKSRNKQAIEEGNRIRLPQINGIQKNWKIMPISD